MDEGRLIVTYPFLKDPVGSNMSRLNPKECQVVGMFCDQSPSTKSKGMIYKIKYNKTTVNILVLIVTGLYVLIRYNFSEMTGDELSTSVKEVWVSARSRRTVPEDTILIEHPENTCWGESRTIINKTKLVSQITGYRPRIASYKDEVCMKDYLEKSRLFLFRKSQCIKNTYLSQPHY